MPGKAQRKRHKQSSSNTTPWFSAICKTCDVEATSQLEELRSVDRTSDCDGVTPGIGSQYDTTPSFDAHHKFTSINDNIIDVALEAVELVMDPALPKVGVSLLSLRSRYRRLDTAAEVAFEKGDNDLSNLKYQHALQLKQRALLFSSTAEGQKEILAEIATSINNLAYMRQERRDAQVRQSLFCYETVLQIKQYIHGPCHISIGATLNNLGSIHFFAKNCYEAISYFRRARKVFRSILGLEHLDICTVSSNIGDVFYHLKHWKRAATEYRSALHLRWIILGRKDPKVVRLMEVLADTEMKLLESQRNQNASSVPKQLLEMDEDCQSDDGSFAAEVDNLQREINEDLHFFQVLEQEAPHKLIRDKVSMLKELRQLSRDDPTLSAPPREDGAQQRRWLRSDPKDSFCTTETSIASDQSERTKTSEKDARAQVIPPSFSSTSPRGVKDELDELLTSAIGEVDQAVAEFNELGDMDDSGCTSVSSLSTGEPSLSHLLAVPRDRYTGEPRDERGCGVSQTAANRSTAHSEPSFPIRALTALATTGYILSHTTSQQNRCEETAPAQSEASPVQIEHSMVKQDATADPNMDVSESCPVTVVTTLATTPFVLPQHQESIGSRTDSNNPKIENALSLSRGYPLDDEDNEPTDTVESRNIYPQQGHATSAKSNYPIKALTALATTAFVLHHRSNQDTADSTMTGTGDDDDDNSNPPILLEARGNPLPLVIPDDQQAIVLLDCPPPSLRTDDRTLESENVLHSLKPLSTYTCLRRSRGAKQLSHAERDEALQQVRRRLEERRCKRVETVSDFPTMT